MSWFWGKTEKVQVEEELEDDESTVDNADDNDEVIPLRGESNNNNDNNNNNNESYDETSDESSVENASDSEDDGDFDDDDDDDSLVEDLIDSMTTDDDESEDDISLVEDTPDDGINASFDSIDTDEDEAALVESLDQNGRGNPIGEPSHEEGQDILSTDNISSTQQENDDEADNEDPEKTSFWEKQSLLILAAEHDRVDILKTLVKDENEEKDALLNSGIPPLHLAISFGSVNTAQSLLRMGADPSVRPNIDKVLEQRKNQPEDSKVDIPNIRRFESISAWELAFGNALYEKTAKSKKSWSMFGSSGSADIDDAGNRIIKPVDMAPSKREGIRHAFTAEALRSIGSDEAERLKQLVNSGMPATIDIGGNDLYGWAVEMGALQCEEFLRPVEAAKYDETDNENRNNTPESETPSTSTNEDEHDTSSKQPEENKKSSSFVVHRPDNEETIPQLKNRLDELDSLSVSLSVCLDNLAEEVSVCHGLLLMGGGASALASHVRSLRDLKEQKLIELEDAQFECLDVERELTDLVNSTGDIGKEISKMANTNFLTGDSDSNDGRFNTGTSMSETGSGDDSPGEKEVEAEKLDIKAQIAASEHKIRKLRASIMDLSEENTRDLKEVERRGLEGGINLVRGLREELRDLDFHLSEARSMKTACKAKISMILARVQPHENKSPSGRSEAASATEKPEVDRNERSQGNSSSAISDETATTKISAGTSISQTTLAPIQQNNPTLGQDGSKKILNSTKIATGDSRAIAIIQPGNKGFFTVDLWEVLLRIIGFEHAANRRSVQSATRSTSTSRSNVMTV